MHRKRKGNHAARVASDMHPGETPQRGGHRRSSLPRNAGPESAAQIPPPPAPRPTGAHRHSGYATNPSRRSPHFAPIQPKPSAPATARLGIPVIRIQLADSSREHPVQIVELGREPLVLARPIAFVPRVDIVEINRDSTISSCGQLLPLKRILKLALDVILLLAEEMEERLRLAPSEVEFRTDLPLWTAHDRADVESGPADRIRHPRLRLRLAVPRNRPTDLVQHGMKGIPVGTLSAPSGRAWNRRSRALPGQPSATSCSASRRC